MKKQKLLLLVALFLVVMVAAGVGYNTLKEDNAPEQLSTQPTTQDQPNDQPQDFSAPDFTVVDLSGQAHKLSDFVGQPIVLNFWASWCGPCKSEMPDFQKAYETYGDRIHFVMVNLTDGSGETVKTASDFIASAGYTFPVYYDTLSDAAMTYGVNAVPVTYFIDSSGQLVAYGQGALDAWTLQSGIDMILSE